MEEQRDKSAAATQQEEEQRIRKTREIDALGGVREMPKPRHGDPTEAAPPAPGESVLGVRVGSEAAVESGTGPVLPPPTQAGGEFTRVRNKDLAERDRKEFKKRGMRADGTLPAGRATSVSFEGVMVVEPQGEGQEATLHSGGYTGYIPPEGLLIRPPTEREEREFFGTPAREGESARASDLVKGGGQGGGGNPMHRGDVRGVSSQTAERVQGSGPGVTSKTGPSPSSRPASEGAPKPQGGGTTSRDNR